MDSETDKPNPPFEPRKRVSQGAGLLALSVLLLVLGLSARVDITTSRTLEGAFLVSAWFIAFEAGRLSNRA